MACGDHLIATRLGYEHHGIDAGDDRVIHYVREGGRKRIEETPLSRFARGRTLKIVQPSGTFTPDEVLARARSRIGEERYDLLANNCEHFARWAAHGRQECRQLERLGLGAAALIVLVILQPLLP